MKITLFLIMITFSLQIFAKQQIVIKSINSGSNKVLHIFQEGENYKFQVCEIDRQIQSVIGCSTIGRESGYSREMLEVLSVITNDKGQSASLYSNIIAPLSATAGGALAGLAIGGKTGVQIVDYILNRSRIGFMACGEYRSIGCMAVIAITSAVAGGYAAKQLWDRYFGNKESAKSLLEVSHKLKALSRDKDLEVAFVDGNFDEFVETLNSMLSKY
jgi:hypothetical protein